MGDAEARKKHLCGASSACGGGNLCLAWKKSFAGELDLLRRRFGVFLEQTFCFL